jgi:hypothetical protein
MYISIREIGWVLLGVAIGILTQVAAAQKENYNIEELLYIPPLDKDK